MTFYTFVAALLHISFFAFAVYADEPATEPNLGVMRFGRSDFQSELPGMMFGKRELPGMMFGKRNVEDMGLMFGKRELPGMMFGKRNVEDMGLMFGKRPDNVQAAKADELYRTIFRTMHGKRDMTMQEMQGPMFGKRPEEPERPDVTSDQLAKLASASFGKRDPEDAKNEEDIA